MSDKRRIAATLIVLALLGCKGAQPTSASSGAGEGAATASGVATKVAYITDPTLNNMNAVGVTIPSRWQLKGTLFQGDSCETVPMVVYRATSPDGLSMEEQEPGMAWRWGTGPRFDFASKGDCLPIKGPMSAQDFLKYFAGTMKMNYVGPDPVPAAINANAQQKMQDSEAEVAPKYAAMHAQPPKSTRELARAIVTYQKGTVSMKGRLHLVEDCMEVNYPGEPQLEGRPPRMVPGPPSTINSCTASVTLVAAPDAKFAEVVRGLDASEMGAKMEGPWMQAWIQRGNEQTQNTIRIMRNQSEAFMRSQQQQFEHDQAVRQNMHDQFIQNMNAQGDRNTENFINHENARDTETSDFVDYALDRQTVMNTNTGQTYKITNQVTVGGDLQQVHGNGSPW
jgi:hypothetical protein